MKKRDDNVKKDDNNQNCFYRDVATEVVGGLITAALLGGFAIAFALVASYTGWTLPM